MVRFLQFDSTEKYQILLLYSYRLVWVVKKKLILIQDSLMFYVKLFGLRESVYQAYFYI